MPVVPKEGGPWSLFCTDCRVWTPNTANAEMKKEGVYANSHVCGHLQKDEVRDEDYRRREEKRISIDALQRIAAFLSQYTRGRDGGVILPEVAMVLDSIGLLLEEGVMTEEELRREALEEYDVIIPEELLPARSDKQ